MPKLKAEKMSMNFATGDFVVDKENVVSVLWEECINIFSTSNKEHLREVLKNLIEIVRKNDSIFQEKADLEFLDFIVQMDANEYIVGTNGDDFELMLKTYIQREDISVEIIWQILSQLIWDLSVPVTDKVCPFCHCDHVILLVDKGKLYIYESCENCFGTSKNGKQIMRPDGLFPANQEMIKRYIEEERNVGKIVSV